MRCQKCGSTLISSEKTLNGSCKCLNCDATWRLDSKEQAMQAEIDRLKAECESKEKAYTEEYVLRKQLKAENVELKEKLDIAEQNVLVNECMCSQAHKAYCKERGDVLSLQQEIAELKASGIFPKFAVGDEVFAITGQNVDKWEINNINIEESGLLYNVEQPSTEDEYGVTE